MFRNNQETSDRAVDQHSVGVGARIARARRDANLTQRALADRVGVRLGIIDAWETGARAVPPEQFDKLAAATQCTSRWLESGAGERAPDGRVQATVDPDLHQFDPSYEQSRRELDEYLFEVARREADVEQRERELRDALARADEERAAFELGSEEDGAIEAERRQLGSLLLEIARREAELGQREREQRGARVELARREETRRREDERLAERARAVSEREREADLLLESAARIAAQWENDDAVRRAEWENDRPQGLGGEASSLEGRERWLTEAVKSAAKREAETVMELAYQRAKLIIARAEAGHEPQSR